MQASQEPDNSQQLQLCTYLALGAAVRSKLGQFEGALDWYMQALTEFNQKVALEVRAGQSVLEDAILSGVVRSLLSQFRYEDALFFIDLALKGEMFSAYQSEVRHDLRAQKEILPELVTRTRGYEFPASGLKLWADLMEEVQRCKTPEEARETRRRILERIEEHNAAEQVRHLEDAIKSVLRRDYSDLFGTPSAQASLPVPPPAPDLSKITDPGERETHEKLILANRLLLEDALRRAAEIAEIKRTIAAALTALNQRAIAEVHRKASEIYRVPRPFRVKWHLYFFSWACPLKKESMKCRCAATSGCFSCWWRIG